MLIDVCAVESTYTYGYDFN